MKIQELDISKELQDEFHFYEVMQSALFYIFLAFLAVGILLNILTGISLTLDYMPLDRYIMGGFLALGIFIQARRYLLFKKVEGGKSAFLKKRGMIFGFLLILFIIFYLFIEPYMHMLNI